MQDEERRKAELRIQEVLRSAGATNPHMLIIAYVTERGDVAVHKDCREVAAECLLYSSITVAHLKQMEKNFVREMSAETPPEGSLSN